MKRKPHLGRILKGIGLMLFIVAGVMWLIQSLPALHADWVHKSTNELYYGSAFSGFPMTHAYADGEEAEQEQPEISEDFLELYAANPDVVGWLRAGESIDDPVTARDNTYYLTHDFYGDEDSNGTLFMNAANTLFPRDDVILIHGHNMRSGAMFGKLTRFRDYEYMAQYPLIMFRTIYDAEEVYYTPVFAFDASMVEDDDEYFDITPINFEDDVVAEEEQTTQSTADPSDTSAATRHSTAYREYLSALEQVSLWQAAVDVTEDDSLLMLVTCSYEQEDGRFMLVCRALREDETPESITALYGITQ